MKILMTLVFLAIVTGCTTITPYENLKVRPMSPELLRAYENANRLQICDCIGSGSVTSSRFAESLPEARAKAEEELAMCIEKVKENGGLSSLCSEMDARSPSIIYVRDGGEVFALAFLERPSK